MVKNPLVVIYSLMLISLLAPAVMGASIDLQVSTGQHPPNRISSCPDSVLSDIDVMVSNLGGQTDTVMLTLDWPADLGFIKPYQTLASGEEAVVEPLWITIPYNLEPGVYHARITAESSVTGDMLTETIEIEVLRCRSVEILIDDDYGRSCIETQEPVTYEIEVVNQGKWEETFELSASADWAEFSRESVTVAPGGSESVSLVLTPPEGTSPGRHTVFLTAESTESYASDTKSVEMDVVDCFTFTSELEPESLEACLGDSMDYELTITNTGEEEDEYAIGTPEWVYPDRTSTVLGAGESDIITLTALPDEKGIQTFEVTVTSVRDELAAPITLSGIINVKECRGVALIVSPEELSVCRGEEAEFSVNVKNTGSLEETFQISSTFGELAIESVELDAGESETVALHVDSSGLPEGTVIIEVSAAGGPVSDMATAELVVEECYMTEFSLQPDEVTACPGAEIPYTMRVRNTGMQADNYTLRYADETIEFALGPNETRAVSYDYVIPYVEEGRYLFTVELTSEGGISLMESSEIRLKAEDVCYGVRLEDDPGIVDIGKAITIEITITNTGEQADTFMVSLKDAPEWAYIEPDEVQLGGGENESLYLYLSPGFGTSREIYTVTVEAESEHSSDELDISVTIPEEMLAPPEAPLEPGEPGENVSINVTHPGEGAPVTGGLAEERPFWKTAAVAIIALIIVVILVIRFVLLFKK
jgi:uncharacterized membrane protein